MAKKLSAQLASLQSTAAALNELCNNGAEIVRGLEDFLSTECSIGIEASVLLSDNSDEYACRQKRLCYGRLGDRFRVYLQWYDSSDPPHNEYSVKLWAECKREDKIATIPLLVDLVQAIDAEAQARLDSAKQAFEAIGALSKAKKPGAKG